MAQKAVGSNPIIRPTQISQILGYFYDKLNPMKYGLFGKFTAQPGKRDELKDILLQAAELLQQNPECIHYLIGTTDQPDDVWVIETWESKEAHDKSLEPENIRTLIKTAMPLIASMPEQTELDTHGGKGIS